MLMRITGHGANLQIRQHSAVSSRHWTMSGITHGPAAG